MSEGKAVKNDHKIAAQAFLNKRGLSEEWEIRIPYDDEILIDWDSAHPPAIFARVFEVFAKCYPGATYEVSFSKSGNLHCIMKAPNEKFVNMERVMWQAIFGSDPMREALHVQNIRSGNLNPIILFERKR